MLANPRDLAKDAACRNDFVAGRECVDEFSVRLLPFLLIVAQMLFFLRVSGQASVAKKL